MSCSTLGGYPTTRPSLLGDPQQCSFPFTYKNVTYNSCISMAAANPFMNPLDPNDLVQVPGLTTWCSLLPSYSLTDGTRRMWGYCVCAQPPTAPTTQGPTLRPTTRQPSTLTPTTLKPSSLRPSTSAPTKRPTNLPTNAPTTRKPTTRALTNQPTRAPTTQRPTTRAPTKRPSTLAPTKKVTSRPTFITNSPTPVPTQYPTFVTATPVAIRNETTAEDMLSNPVVAAGVGVGGSLIIFGLFFLVLCFASKLRKKKSVNHTVVAYPGQAAPKGDVTVMSSKPRRFPLTRPKWGEEASNDAIVVHSSDPEEPSSSLPTPTRSLPRPNSNRLVRKLSFEPSVAIAEKEDVVLDLSASPSLSPAHASKQIISNKPSPMSQKFAPVPPAPREAGYQPQASKPAPSKLNANLLNSIASSLPIGSSKGTTNSARSDPPPQAPKPIVVPSTLAIPVPVKQSGNVDLEKYKKMMRIGLSHDAVKHAMNKDGVPTSLIPELQ